MAIIHYHNSCKSYNYLYCCRSYNYQPASILQRYNALLQRRCFWLLQWPLELRPSKLLPHKSRNSWQRHKQPLPPPKPSLHTGPKGQTNRHRQWHVPLSGCAGWRLRGCSSPAAPTALARLQSRPWLEPGARSGQISCACDRQGEKLQELQTGDAMGSYGKGTGCGLGGWGYLQNCDNGIEDSGWSSGLQMQLELQPEMSDRMALQPSRPTHGWRRSARCITWLMQAGHRELCNNHHKLIAPGRAAGSKVNDWWLTDDWRSGAGPWNKTNYWSTCNNA